MPITFRESTWSNPRNQKLFTVEYAPANEPRAIITWHHGYGEHIGRYDYVFNKFAEAGYAVHSYDCHGHGKSEPLDKASRVYIERFQHLLDDFQAFNRHIMTGYPHGTPLFIGGHSMGGLVAVETVLRDQSSCQGLILSSALLYKELNMVLRVQAAVASALSSLFPRRRMVPAVDKKFLNKDAKLIDEYMNDPLNDVADMRVATAWQLLQATRNVEHHEAELKVPFFAFHGDEDGVTSVKGTQRIVNNAASHDKTIFIVEGGYHEILQNPEHRDAMIDRMVGWINHRAPAARL